MSGRLNGSGAVKDDRIMLFPARSSGDITRSNIPIMIAISVTMAVAAGAFHVGGLFSRYTIERGEILDRLSVIEGKLDRLLPGALHKSRTADK